VGARRTVLGGSQATAFCSVVSHASQQKKKGIKKYPHPQKAPLKLPQGRPACLPCRKEQILSEPPTTEMWFQLWEEEQC
jgi:hypothetical protein